MTDRFYNLDKLNVCYFMKSDVAENLLSNFNIMLPNADLFNLGSISSFSGLSLSLRHLDGAEASFCMYLNTLEGESSTDVLVGEFKIDYKNSGKIFPFLYSHIIINNKYLYTHDRFTDIGSILDYLKNILTLDLHQVSQFELALDTNIDISAAILGAIRSPELTTIQLGHRVVSREEDLNAIGFEFYGNSDRFTRCSVRIRKKEGKAKRDKESNAQLYGYNKTIEVKKSNKQYILDAIGNPDYTVYRLEVRMDSHTINNYLNTKYKNSGFHKFEKNTKFLYEYILNPECYQSLFDELSNRFIRFSPKRGKILSVTEILSSENANKGWSEVNGVHSQTLDVVVENTVSNISSRDIHPTSDIIILNQDNTLLTLFNHRNNKRVRRKRMNTPTRHKRKHKHLKHKRR